MSSTVIDPNATLQEVELELKRRKYEDPLALVYKPHERQMQVHKSRATTTLVVGGNRAGKSWSGVAEALLVATGRAVWAEVPEPPTVIWYVMPSMGMFERAILPIFRKLCPQKELARFRESPYYIAEFRNGSQLHFLSADMKQKRLQGASIDLAIQDETPDERVYDELLARVLDRKGRLLLILAPIDAASHWIRDKLYIPWKAGDKQDVDVIHMPVADQEGRSLVPYFTDEDVAAMERRWPDPQVRAARIYGEFITRSGLIFSGYDPDVHIIPSFNVPPEYARWWIVDPQYHRFAALFFSADHEGNVYVTDEYFSRDEHLAHRAQRLAAITGEREKPLPVYCDSANPQDAAELNWHFSRVSAPLAAHQLPFQKKVEKMILRVHSLLEPDDDRPYPSITGLIDVDGNPFYGAPRLFFFDRLVSTWIYNSRAMNCSRLLWEIQRLSWGKTGRPDKDSADGSDCLDALAYGCSILSAGVKIEKEDVWQKNLPVRDQIIYRAMEQGDKSSKMKHRER